MICYDVTSPKSVEALSSWISEIKEKGEKDVVWMLVGCKCDCPSVVNDEAIEAIVRENGCLQMVCSAKSGESLFFDNEIY